MTAVYCQWARYSMNFYCISFVHNQTVFISFMSASLRYFQHATNFCIRWSDFNSKHSTSSSTFNALIKIYKISLFLLLVWSTFENRNIGYDNIASSCDNSDGSKWGTHSTAFVFYYIITIFTWSCYFSHLPRLRMATTSILYFIE